MFAASRPTDGWLGYLGGFGFVKIKVMAAYKVLQDVEAEDKLLGPMTARQLLYAGLASALLFVGYLVADKTNWWVMTIFAIPALPFIYLAAPLGRDQPNDIWLLARLNYLIRPRKRTWQKDGASQRVVIKAKTGKAEPEIPGDSDEVVDSRLKRLANTLDTRTNQFEFPAGETIAIGQPVVDPYLSEEHPTAGRFDFLLNRYQNQAQAQLQAQVQIQSGQIQTWAPTTPQPPISQSAAISQLAATDDLKIATIAGLANQPPTQTNY